MMPLMIGEEPSAEVLESGYDASHRIYELSGILATVATGSWLVLRLSSARAVPVWWFPLTCLLGLLGADLMSGIIHWGFDTWGDLDTPLIGKLAIRTFRQHHVDPTIMLRHDFVETNGHNITLALVLTSSGLWAVPAEGASASALFTGLSLLAMAIFVSLTSQIHKWAHTPTPPRLVVWLQRARLVLSPEHHAQHHVSPHLRNYCITVGWFNGLLTALGVFERAERLIEWATGVVPRRPPHLRRDDG
jgi:hypothetical protein